LDGHDHGRTPTNPYEAPDAPLGAPRRAPRDGRRAAEAMRLRHLDDEALVRSVALLFRLATVAIPLLIVVVVIPAAPPVSAAVLVAAALLGPVFTEAVGRGLNRLRTWARLAAIATSGIGLAGVAAAARFAAGSGNEVAPFGVGLLLVPVALVLYILLSGDGRTVFSRAYQDAVASTPRVRARTSPLVPFVFLLSAFWAALTYWQGLPH